MDKLGRGINVRSTVLASDLCIRLLDGYKVKMTAKNCPNYTMKEENARAVMPKLEKGGQLSNPS